MSRLVTLGCVPFGYSAPPRRLRLYSYSQPNRNEVKELLEKAHNRMLQSCYERKGPPTTNGYGSVA